MSKDKKIEKALRNISDRVKGESEDFIKGFLDGYAEGTEMAIKEMKKI